MSAVTALSPERLRGAVAARGRQLRERAVLERDYWAFRRRYGRIVGPTPPTGGGIALIASLTYGTYQAKLEGMIAKALQIQGLEPVAAVLPDAEFPRRLLELYGVRRFVHLDDYLDGPALEEASRTAEELLADVQEPADLRALTYRGADVGREALSTVSRYLHEGGVDLAEPRARALLRDLLPRAVSAVVASEALLDDVRPDVVVFCERNYANEGPLSDTALGRGLDVVQFVSGFEDDSLVFKRYTAATKGLHPRSISDETWPRIAALPWSEERERELEWEFTHRYDGTTFLARLHQSWTREQSREEVVGRLGLDPARKTAVIFSHVLWDANMFYGRDLFADQEEWFVETVRAACENERVNWVVKLHPANVWKRKRDGVTGELDEITALADRIGELPPHVHLLRPETDVSTWSLFALTDVGVTIRGSIGWELPCLGVPTLTAGTGFYSGRGFTVDSATAAEYLDRIRSIEDVAPPTEEQVLLAKKHAWALMRLRQTRFSTFRALFQPLERIDAPFEATIEVFPQSFEELLAAEDLRRLGAWIARSREPDYLHGDA